MNNPNLIAVAVLLNLLNVRHHLGHVVGHARDGVGRQHVERGHVGEEARLLSRRQPQKVRLHVAHLFAEYAERRIKYGILFIFSPFYEYTNLEYVHVPV